MLGKWIKARGSSRKPVPVTVPVSESGRPAEPGVRGRARGADARLRELEGQLGRERAHLVSAAARAQEEAGVARRALEEAGRARLERDEYRRVLAAAIANERKALDEARRERQACATLEGRLTETVLGRGVAEGRAQELERGSAGEEARHAQELADARDRAWAERERLQDQLQRATIEAAVTRSRVRELEAQALRAPPPPAAGALARRVAQGAAVFCAVLALVLAPAGLLAAFSSSSGAYLTLALGLGPWELVLSTLGFAVLALVFGRLAARPTRPATAPSAGVGDVRTA